MPSRLLYLGCQPGQDVMDLQDGLNAVTGDPGQSSAYPPLAVDGVFGGKTASRVREFQQNNGLAADGIVGPATWGALIGLLQGIPGLQINRPIGGSGPGPAKGTDGSAVYGKPASGGSGGGGKEPAGSGNSQAKGASAAKLAGQKKWTPGGDAAGGSAKGSSAANFAGQKKWTPGGDAAGGSAKGSGGYGDAGGGKASSSAKMGGSANQGSFAGKDWGSAYGGSYKGGGDATSLKGDGGGSGDGGGVKGGGGKRV